jgi:hypothetical protein
VDVPALYDKAGTNFERLEYGLRFRGPGLFQGQTGAVQQGDSEKSGTKFRPEANSFQTKRKLLSVQFFTRSGRLHILRHNVSKLKLLNERSLWKPAWQVYFWLCNFLKTNMV